MNSPQEALKPWLYPAVFATWSGFLIYMVASQRYVDFLRPGFGILLVLAHFIALGFMLAAIMRSNKRAVDVSAILRALVLMVPVLYFMAAPDTTLGNQAFKKRFIGTNNGAIGRQAPPAISSQGAESDPNLPAPPGDIKAPRQEATRERTILEIYLDPNSYKGQRVIFTGMILRDEQLKPYFGGMDTAVYRFLINCCVADALPLAIALDSEQTDAFANDQWVQVDGVFDIQQINGKPVPMVSEPRIKPVETPGFPYLF